MKTQNRSRWNSLYLREWNIGSHKLDVQETSFSLTQVCPTWSDVVRCKSTWKELPLLICGIILHFNPEQGATCCGINTVKTFQRKNEETVGHVERSGLDRCWLRHVKRKNFLASVLWFIYCCEDIEATMKMIIKGGSRTIWHVSELTELR